MTPNPALTITLGAQAGDGESHWLRLEQVEMADEGATMEQAAALIDALYGIEPCDGMGTGGKEADNEALPDEAEFLKRAGELLKLGACEESGVWDAEVDVYRSHQTDGYSLQGERIEAGETTPMRRAVTETVELDGASYDLQWPYGGDISVSGGAVIADVRGSTVNFAAPVRGVTRIRYTAVWDRVKVRVRPAVLGQGDPLAGLHYVAGPPQTPTREDEAASVVAFWRDLAAECRLTRPPLDDQGLEQTEIQRLCNRKTDWNVKGDCWQTIETYNICNCSGRESPDVPEREDVDAPCPDGVRPDSFLGVERRRGEYVDCPGEDRELLNDPDFYRSRCCDEPYPNLPRCRVTREPYRGGAEIENGPEYWRDIYGPTVRMIPITPEGGCGEIIRKWDVPMWRDCGDTPPGPDECDGRARPGLPATQLVAAGTAFELSITDGLPPFVWQALGLTLEGVSSPNARTAYFSTTNNFGAGTATATDLCGRVVRCRVRTPDDMEAEDDDPSQCYAWRWIPVDQYGSLPGGGDNRDCGSAGVEGRKAAYLNPPGGPFLWTPETTAITTYDGFGVRGYRKGNFLLSLTQTNRSTFCWTVTFAGVVNGHLVWEREYHYFFDGDDSVDFSGIFSNPLEYATGGGDNEFYSYEEAGPNSYYSISKANGQRSGPFYWHIYNYGLYRRIRYSRSCT